MVTLLSSTAKTYCLCVCVCHPAYTWCVCMCVTDDWGGMSMVFLVPKLLYNSTVSVPPSETVWGKRILLKINVLNSWFKIRLTNDPSLFRSPVGYFQIQGFSQLDTCDYQFGQASCWMFMKNTSWTGLVLKLFDSYFHTSSKINFWAGLLIQLVLSLVMLVPMPLSMPLPMPMPMPLQMPLPLPVLPLKHGSWKEKWQ